MPLQKGSDPQAIGANIAELVRAGHSPDQAAAIAYNVAQGQDTAAGVMYRAGDSVLLLLRSASSAAHPATWGFPGGSIDEGETAEQAAIRESQEEIGYSPEGQLQVLDWRNGFTTFTVNVESPFVPILNEEHTGYAWSKLEALPSPMHPSCAATFAILPPQGVGQDERFVDTNGWFENKDNPISRAGIFPYSGRQLGLTGTDADRIFQVLRPPEELGDPECVNSFKLLPWVDEHAMLGPIMQEASPTALAAEKKGVQGVIGEDVYFKDGVLYGNIKAFSNTLAQLIKAGKRQLSAGYRCIYEITSGVWNGQSYDAVQRKIRGNHLALVPEGRMGPDVAVMDRLSFSFDAKEVKMQVENKDGGAGTGAMTLEQVVATVTELAPQVAKLTAAMGSLMGAAEKAEHQATGEIPVDDKAVCDKEPVDPVDGGEGTPAGAAMDAALKKINSLESKVQELTANGERAMLSQLARRDALVKQLSAHVGTFDHAEKTHDDVVAYGCEKLGIKAAPGQEAAALSGYLQARPVAVPPSFAAMDAANKATGANFVTRFVEGK